MAILRVSHGESAGGDEGNEPESRAPASEDPENEPETSSSAEGPEGGVDLLWEADEQTLVAPMNALERHLRLVAQADKPAAKVPMPGHAVRQHEEARPAAQVQSGSIYQEPDADPDDANTLFDDEIDRALDRFAAEHASDGSAQPSFAAGVDVDIVAEQRVENPGGNVAFERPDVASGQMELPPPRPQTGYPFPLAPPLPPLPMGQGMPGAGWPGGVPPGYPHTAYPGVRAGTAPFSTPSGQFPAVTGSYSTMSGQFPSVTGQFPSVTGSIPYILQPVVAGPAFRWVLGLAVVLVATTAVGVGLGWFLFARPGVDADETPAAAGAPDPAAVTEARAVYAPPAPAATAPPAATPPAAASPAAPSPAVASPAVASPAAPVVVEIRSLVHPPLMTVTAPIRGEIASSSIRAARRVRKGDKLFQIRRKRPGRGDRAELSRRVTELERLAKEDPVYEAFLARARDEAAKARRGGEISSSVRASVGGLVEPRVRRGDRVRQGEALAVISNPEVWTVKASLRGAEPTREWSCAITPAAGGSRAACRIEQVSTAPAGVKIEASVEASQVPWLRRADQKPRLLLEPPPAR